VTLLRGVLDKTGDLLAGVRDDQWHLELIAQCPNKVLIELIIGSQVQRVFPDMPPVTDTSPALEIEDLWERLYVGSAIKPLLETLKFGGK